MTYDAFQVKISSSLRSITQLYELTYGKNHGPLPNIKSWKFNSSTPEKMVVGRNVCFLLKWFLLRRPAVKLRGKKGDLTNPWAPLEAAGLSAVAPVAPVAPAFTVPPADSMYVNPVRMLLSFKKKNGPHKSATSF